MPKNVTIWLDDQIIKNCRHVAVEEDKSLSQWIADERVKVVSAQDMKDEAKKRALKRLGDGLSLGGTPFPREEIYAE